MSKSLVRVPIFMGLPGAPRIAFIRGDFDFSLNWGDSVPDSTEPLTTQQARRFGNSRRKCSPIEIGYTHGEKLLNTCKKRRKTYCWFSLRSSPSWTRSEAAPSFWRSRGNTHRKREEYCHGALP